MFVVEKYSGKELDVRQLTCASVGTSVDELVRVGAGLRVDVVVTYIVNVDVDPAAKWNQVDIDVDGDAAGSSVAVV